MKRFFKALTATILAVTMIFLKTPHLLKRESEPCGVCESCMRRKRGFKKAQKRLDVPCENIAAIGDQIFTDVIGGNSLKMFSILVKPLAEKDLWMTRFKRPIEELVIKNYLKKIGG